jgi:RNA polymerase sigma factor (sigma-70 family)
MSHFSNTDLNSDEEIRLANSVRQGNKEAYGKLYNRYAAPLLGFIQRILGDQHRSEKILQAAFLRYWQDIKLYDPTKERLFIWMLGIARTLALDTLKTASGEVSPTTESKTPRSAQQKNRADVKVVYMNENANFAAQSHQNFEEIKALDLVCYKGYTMTEAAWEFGISTEILKQKLREEIKLLREVKIDD